MSKDPRDWNTATEISIRVGEREVRGRWGVDKGVVWVSTGTDSKSTQIGGSPPEVLAKMLLRELAASEN